VSNTYDGFTHIGEETFSCGALENTVAVYRHDLFAKVLELEEGERDARVEFVEVPGGTFRMGLDADDVRSLREFNEELEGGLEVATPPREVTVEGFLIARTPLTQEVWDGIAAELDLELWDQRYTESPYLPVHGLSWAFFTEIAPDLHLSLPTEAQWEYAARGGSELAYPWGDTAHSAFEYAWYGHPHEGGPMGVAQKKPNAFGLHDVAGNVWELCQDHWHESHNGAPDDGSARESGDDSLQRVMRGGSFRSPSEAHLLCAFRSAAGIYFTGDDLGIRPVAPGYG
jgi:formylglycine-generating enzyme required for sulfatase activity